MAVNNKGIRKSTAKRTGRPLLYDTPMKPFPLKLTDDQRQELEAAAKRAKATSLNEWARAQLLAAARTSTDLKVPLKFTDDQHEELEAAAKRAKAASLNEWARTQLLAAARTPSDPNPS
jgi:predicted HicB family RNase H-like nuclease